MTVESLKSVFDTAALVLLFLTAVAGTGVLITGNIINRRQAQQLQTFDVDITAAKTELAKQQVRAANAEASIALAEQHSSEAKAKAEGFRSEIAKANEGAAEAAARAAAATAESAKANDRAAQAANAAEAERVKRVKLESSIAPRVLSSPQGDARARLEAFAGTKFNVRYLPDAEAERAASFLVSAIQSVGWKMNQVIPDPATNAPNFDGVLVRTWGFTEADISIKAHGAARMAQLHELMTRQEAAGRPAEELVDFLRANGWDASESIGFDKSLEPGTLEVVVGFKPSPYFDPEQIRTFHEAAERFRRREIESERQEDQRSQKPPR